MKNRLALLLLLAASLAMAEGKRVYLNFGKVFDGYYKTLNANVVFEQKKAELQSGLAEQAKGVDEALAAVQKAEKEAKNELLNEAARAQVVNKLRARVKMFEEQRDSFEKARQAGALALRKLRGENLESLSRELREVLQKYAAEKGYEEVVDISGLSLNQIPIYLVYPKKQDITEAFLALINQGHAAEITAALQKIEAWRKQQAAQMAPVSEAQK